MKDKLKEEFIKKWNHVNSPMGKSRDKLEDKRRQGTLTANEKIELNNLSVEFYKDMVRYNRRDAEFADMMIIEIKNWKRK